MRGFKVLAGLAVAGGAIAALFDVSFPAGVVIASGAAFVGVCAYGLIVGAGVIRRARRHG